MSIKNCETLEDVKKYYEEGFGAGRSDALHCGSIRNIGRVDKEADLGYQSLVWLMENRLPPLRLIKWGELEELRKKKKISSWGGLQSQSSTYVSYLPYMYAAPSNTPNSGDMSIMWRDYDYTTFKRVLPEEIKEKFSSEINQTDERMISSVYYHSAKAHWLMDSIQSEGLWAPVQGKLEGEGSYRMSIHPGSVRSPLFEELDDPDLELLLWDKSDMGIGKILTPDEVLSLFNKTLQRQGQGKHMSIMIQGGVVEFSCSIADLSFRKKVCTFNKNIHENAKGKPLTIYIGYDSRHRDISKVCEKSITENMLKWIKGEPWTNITEELLPKIKFLDISKIPEYTREYANQSTEFTYSRFLIPYLENYEGFSMFVDDDFIFTKSPLPMFYYVDPSDAVTCVQYGDFEPEESKFNGEKNVSYDKKLWSSLMFFNNSHPDCKKLTPEVVNTESGKFLHQFEWTDSIGKIPEKYIFTEGYDDPDEKWNHTAVHFTRGGPWIEGMDTSNIDLLDVYENVKSKINH